MHIHTIPLLSCIMLLSIHIAADPLMHIKNNSNRLISVQPLMGNNIINAQLVYPDDEYILDDFIARINGLVVKYCPSSYAGTGCNESQDGLNQFGKTVTFTFNPPEASRYYLKITIDKKDNVSLVPQKGSFGSTSNSKWSLKGNITEKQISKATAAPTDRPALPAKTRRTPPARPTVAAPTDEDDIDAALEDLDRQVAEARKKPAPSASYRTDESNVPEHMRRNKPSTGSGSAPVESKPYRTDEANVPEYMRRNKPATGSRPAVEEDIEITLMPETLTRQTIIPAPK